MTDPAIAAAQRAWDLLPERSYATREQVMKAAAREALRPIREHIEKIPAGLDATDLYDELDFIYRRLLGGHCEECRND
ncbi:hypothetical protein I3U64_11825 [Mycobacteroides abscessus subsp. abscessus]|uniref:hypothetical protein n=1 Tax=Mycobacteroides abscessus TaxID=36809 RepID=UPI0009D2D136|nr:hypothetical protein [Mycobacteroides abscessus]MBN7460840.1 hypothetical protein [Mycobacteroides abscessus subsp. abscessus]QSM02294.1 hypothetical protein PROPHIGD86-1_19 [Mycobacterium phage prophi86-1]SLF57728.1 Uncharacterised protein [Mycobacteroides abscessus subsp. abscessus]